VLTNPDSCVCAGMSDADPNVADQFRAMADVASPSVSGSVDLDTFQIALDVTRSFYDDHRGFLRVRRQMQALIEVLESLVESYESLEGVRLMAVGTAEDLNRAINEMADNIRQGLNDIRRTREAVVMTD